ncbi:ATP-binding cassette domain-containing protein [Streptomyces sp. NPDC001922]|uniref:ABC transporter ATP-binding protein n=1 Tax=Streptomyces sp. NPDC001922 TaxID=3364624 RepID=UPI00369B2FAA
MPGSVPDRTVPPDALHLREVTRRYGRGSRAVHALRGIDLRLPSGSFTAVMGPSGSGKSTFLHCAAGLDRPSSGSVRLGGQELSRMRERRLTRLRRARIGFVFQSFNLLPALTVEENVLLPLRLDGRRAGRDAAARALADVGLADRAHHRPGQLSGGQQQRVAVARALITRPEVVFADEPTGALDTVTAAEVLGLLRDSVDRLGATVVMVTHDPAGAAWADRVLLLDQGRIAEDLSPEPGTARRERQRDAEARRIAARMRALAAPERPAGGLRAAGEVSVLREAAEIRRAGESPEAAETRRATESREAAEIRGSAV